jgi:Uma2 family endonuclease
MRAQPLDRDGLFGDDPVRGFSAAHCHLQEVAVNTAPRFLLAGLPAEGWTHAEVDALREDVPFRTEIIDGTLIVSPAAHPWHNDVVRTVTNALIAAVPHSAWAFSETEIRCDDENLVRHSLVPDVLVAPRVLRERDQTYAVVKEVQLVVGVVSPSSRRNDRQVKPALYAELGIPAMWRVERGLTVTEYRATSRGAFEIVQEVAGGTFHTDVPFPVTIDLDALR